MAERTVGTTTLNVADDQRLKASHLFTSESVTEGHPDKIADQISDAILDAALADDPGSRVACETLVTTGLVVVAGEITTSTYVDIPTLVRRKISEIGYTRAKFGFDAETCGVITSIEPPSARTMTSLTSGPTERARSRCATRASVPSLSRRCSSPPSIRTARSMG